MGSDFLVAAGQVVGALVGVGLLGLCFYVGVTWGGLKRAISTTSAAVARTEEKVDGFGPRIERIELTLHGPLGDNGLYQDVRDIKTQLRETPGTPARRRTDRRKVS